MIIRTIIYTFTLQMGPALRPNGNEPCVRTQIVWVLRQDPSRMGLVSGPTQANGSADLRAGSGHGPLSVGSGVRTQIAWVQTRTQPPWV
jgi:hypothetical protein